MSVWTRCCNCKKQTKINGFNIASVTCDCGCERLDITIGSKPPEWFDEDSSCDRQFDAENKK